VQKLQNHQKPGRPNLEKVSGANATSFGGSTLAFFSAPIRTGPLYLLLKTRHASCLWTASEACRQTSPSNLVVMGIQTFPPSSCRHLSVTKSARDLSPSGRPTEKDKELIRCRNNKEPVLEVTMKDGSKRRVWCTFGPEQIDINPTSPAGRVAIPETFLWFQGLFFGSREFSLVPGTFLWFQGPFLGSRDFSLVPGTFL
jgi:hypothetical protein